jgi:hypothetical protein
VLVEGPVFAEHDRRYREGAHRTEAGPSSRALFYDLDRVALIFRIVDYLGVFRLQHLYVGEDPESLEQEKVEARAAGNDHEKSPHLSIFPRVDGVS